MFNLSPDRLRFAMLAVVCMILSSAVHEWAHAFTAVKLGDDTPKRQGRLTLNPLVHIDPFGTVLMPAIGAMAGFLFGYAKPVEFSPVRLTRKLSMRTGILLVALAGPVSNLILAFVCGGLLKLIPTIGGPTIFFESEVAQMFGALLYVGIWFNIVLFLFNFLPIYPLDGSKILEGVLPRRYLHYLDILRQNVLIVMLIVFVAVVPLLSGPIMALTRFVLRLYSLTGQELAPVVGLLG